MKKQINLSSLSKETQARVKKEIAAKKVVATKPLSEEATTFLNKVVQGGEKSWSVTDTGVVNTTNNVSLFDRQEEARRLLGTEITFGLVKGFFSANYCGLKSLQGFPETVTGFLDITGNELEGFEGCPKEVQGDFKCTDMRGLKKFISIEDFKNLPQVGRNVLLSQRSLNNMYKALRSEH